MRATCGSVHKSRGFCLWLWVWCCLSNIRIILLHLVLRLRHLQRPETVSEHLHRSTSRFAVSPILAKAISVKKHTAWLVFSSGLDVAATRP
jgi:hypothetical protein